jgi:hypothetical protein
MKSTHSLSVSITGYGHWLISTDHYGKKISCTTTNARAIDQYKQGETQAEVNRGYKQLRKEIIGKN